MVNLVRSYRTVITDGLLQRWGNVMMTDRACWRGTYMTGLVKSESNGYVAVDMLHNTSGCASFRYNAKVDRETGIIMYRLNSRQINIQAL